MPLRRSTIKTARSVGLSPLQGGGSAAAFGGSATKPAPRNDASGDWLWIMPGAADVVMSLTYETDISVTTFAAGKPSVIPQPTHWHCTSQAPWSFATTDSLPGLIQTNA